MYNFTSPSIQSSPQTDPLPPEALSYNGVQLDKEIPEFTTLAVSGREALMQEIELKTITGINGAKVTSSRIPERKITVFYEISSSTPERYRKAFNDLNRILRDQNVRVIFADEPDKYFIGSAYSKEDPERGALHATGEIEILCPDPFKYSVTEKVVTVPQTGTAVVTNGGNAPAPIRVEVNLKSETEYLGIASSYGGMEYGQKKEVGVAEPTYDQTLFTQAQVKNAPTSGVHHFETINVKSDGDNGTVSEWLQLGTAGDTCTSGSWDHAIKTVTLPADSHGEVGAKDWRLTCMHWFQAGQPGQTGEQVIQLLDANGKEICAYGITCRDRSGFETEVYYRVNGKTVESTKFNSNVNNPFGGGYRGYNDIKKRGSKFSFYFNGKWSYFECPELKDTVCRKVAVAIGHFPGEPYLTRNYIKDITFIKRGVIETFLDQTKLTADGVTGRFYVNGRYTPEKEVRGTTYFKVPPGDTTIQVSLGTYYKGTKDVKIYFREVWL